MVQTNAVIAELQSIYPLCSFQVHEQETLGDKVLDVALSKIGDKGLFTQELEDGLKTGAIDFAVHSLKDLPTRLPEGLTIGCILERVDPVDVVLMRSDLAAKGVKTLQELNDGESDHWIIGTSSLRRQSQIQRRYPNLKCVDIRGNLDTRIKKLQNPDGEYKQTYSAIVLAKAGLVRQGASYTSLITQELPEEDMYYAVGQGALAVECRASDEKTLKLLSALHHAPTASRCLAERSFLRILEGGCHAPIGVSSTLSQDGNTLLLKGRILSLDGSLLIEGQSSSSINHESSSTPDSIGHELATQLLEKGADKILASLKPQTK